jgi:hypothetical protein
MVLPRNFLERSLGSTRCMIVARIEPLDKNNYFFAITFDLDFLFQLFIALVIVLRVNLRIIPRT